MAPLRASPTPSISSHPSSPATPHHVGRQRSKIGRRRPSKKSLLKRAKHIARTVQIRFNANDVMKEGVQALIDADEGGQVAEYESNRILAALMDTIPNLRDLLEADNGTFMETVIKALDEGTKTARSDDTLKLKSSVIDIIRAEGEPLNKINRISKIGRGFHHPFFRKLLTGPSIDPTNPSVASKLQTNQLKPSPLEFPRFLYVGYEVDPGDICKNLFRSELLIKSAKAIFIGPSAIGDDDQSLRPGNAELNGMKSFTVHTIAYVSTHVRFALSSDDRFRTGKANSFYDKFYAAIVDFLTDEDMEDTANEILEYWDLQIFEQQEEQDAMDAVSSAVLIKKQMRLNGNRF